ncbi:hypothetical protein D9M72_597690 [compost metagenome]
MPARPIGLRLACASVLSPGIRRALAPGVGISPGPTALRRIWCRPHSIANDLVIAQMPALAITAGTVNGAPFTTPVLTIDTTEPGWPAAIQRLPAPWVT